MFRPYRLQASVVIVLIVVTSTIGIVQTYETKQFEGGHVQWRCPTATS